MRRLATLAVRIRIDDVIVRDNRDLTQTLRRGYQTRPTHGLIVKSRNLGLPQYDAPVLVKTSLGTRDYLPMEILLWKVG